MSVSLLGDSTFLNRTKSRTMKNFKLFYFSLLLVFAASCGQEEQELSNEQQLLGKWVLTEATMSGTSTLVSESIGELTMTLDGRNSDSDHTLSFFDTGSYTENGEIILTVDFFVDGELFMTEEMNSSELGMAAGSTNDNAGSWNFDGDNLSIDGDRVEVDFSNSELIYNFDEVLEIPLGETGIDGVLTQDMKLQFIYTKQ